MRLYSCVLGLKKAFNLRIECITPRLVNMFKSIQQRGGRKQRVFQLRHYVKFVNSLSQISKRSNCGGKLKFIALTSPQALQLLHFTLFQNRLATTFLVRLYREKSNA